MFLAGNAAESKSDFPVIAVACGAAAGLLLVVGIILCVVCIVCRKNKESQEQTTGFTNTVRISLGYAAPFDKVTVPPAVYEHDALLTLNFSYLYRSTHNFRYDSWVGHLLIWW